MGAATLISRVMGLVREQVFAVLFGAGVATDAFNIAFRIPNLLRDLFAEGAMSSALVPTFTRVRKEEGEARAWRIAGLVFRVLFVLVGVLALVGIFFSPSLVGLYADAFREVTGKFELTVLMTRVLFPFFPLVALAAAFMGILNACGKYFVPAFASALFNLASVASGVLLALALSRGWFSGLGAVGELPPIVGMAVGVVVGGLVQAFSQFPLLRKVGYRFPAVLPSDPPWYREPALRRMLALMVPGTLGLAATQVNVLVNSVLATSQGTGAVSWLGYAFRLMQFPIGVFGVSLAAATLPRLSALWVEKDVRGVADQLARSLRQTIALNLPASAGLVFLGAPIVELLFQYGKFNLADTAATARALAAYALGLAAYSAVKVLVPACYALGRTRLAVVASAVTVGITIALNLAMIGPFGFVGLALGTSLAALANAVLLLLALRRALGPEAGAALDWRTGWGNFFFKQLLASLAMGLFCAAMHRGLGTVLSEDLAVLLLGLPGLVILRASKVAICVLAGILALGFLARTWNLRETAEVFELFSRKLKNRVRGPAK
jgi:putative peptidoglycan lipid II flippase